MSGQSSLKLSKYLSKNAAGIGLEPCEPSQTANAIVIPAMSELEWLPLTLESLAANPPEYLNRTIVITVINANEKSGAETLENNSALLKNLRAESYPFQKRLRLHWLDLSGAPERRVSSAGGVGEARKKGMDAALPFLDWSAKPLLFCLDADTLTQPDYIQTAEDYFRENPDAEGAVYSFAHQRGANDGENSAITLYELHMRYYAAGLAFAKSPYAYHALGSAIVCPAAGYVKAGGMRVKNGGEDFYFMQALRKNGPVGEIRASRVYPSARPSARAPFGTGPKIREIIESKGLKSWNPRVFSALKTVLASAAKNPLEIKDLPQKLETLPRAAKYLRENGFEENWRKIEANTPREPERLLKAFHGWLDAFRTVKLIHYLEAGGEDDYRRLDTAAAAALFIEKNLSVSAPEGAAKLLDYLKNTKLLT